MTIGAQPAPGATLSDMGWSAVFDACAAAQGPVSVARTAAACGVTTRAVRARVRREGWWHPFPDVVAPPGLRIDAQAWARAAVLQATGATGDPAHDLAALTRGSALALLGVTTSAPSAVEVLIPAARRVRASPRLHVVRSRLVGPRDVRHLDGLAVLRGAPLLRDLAGARDLAALRANAIDLLARRHLTLAELECVLTGNARFPGRANLREVAAELATAGRTDSPLELRARRDLAGAGVPLDRGQVPVETAGGRLHLDLGIAAIRFGIEVDSMAHHSAPADLARDARRANAVAATNDDWRILHLDVGDPDRRVAAVRRGGPAGGGCAGAATPGRARAAARRPAQLTRGPAARRRAQLAR